MGFESRLRRQLVSSDVAVTSGRLPVFRYGTGRTARHRRAPLDERPTAHRQHSTAVWIVAEIDAANLAKRIRRGIVRGSSVARRVGGVGRRTQRCPERIFF